jgi:hypothetical protein
MFTLFFTTYGDTLILPDVFPKNQLHLGVRPVVKISNGSLLTKNSLLILICASLLHLA